MAASERSPHDYLAAALQQVGSYSKRTCPRLKNQTNNKFSYRREARIEFKITAITQFMAINGHWNDDKGLGTKVSQ